MEIKVTVLDRRGNKKIISGPLQTCLNLMNFKNS